MVILLAGGAGYIGSHTAVQLLNADHQVVVIDNFCNSSPEAIKRVEKLTGKKIVLYQGDVKDHAVVRRALKENVVDCVIHFAGLKAVGESVVKPVAYYRNNIDTTLTLSLSAREIFCFVPTSIVRLRPCRLWSTGSKQQRDRKSVV